MTLSPLGIPPGHPVFVVASGFQTDWTNKETKPNKVNIWKFSSDTSLLYDLELVSLSDPQCLYL